MAIGEGRCDVAIWHGPGHQSHTYCEVKGEHEIHEATYGEFRQRAEWKGGDVFSGIFDEPPGEDPEYVQRDKNGN